MLQNNLFTLANLQTAGNTITANVQLNPAHTIFEGHFPGQPVLPGVCMMQMVKEVLESTLSKPTRLVRADDLKFLSVIVPQPDKVIRIELTTHTDGASIKTDARLLDGYTVLFKFKGTFVEQ